MFRLSVIFFTNLKNDLKRPRHHYQGDVERCQQVRVLQGIRQRACEQSLRLPAKQNVAAPSEGIARCICVASIATTWNAGYKAKNWEKRKIEFFTKTCFSLFWLELVRSGGVQGDRTDGTMTHTQIFKRFGLTWHHQKVNFSEILEFQFWPCTRNGPQNLLFCPGSLQEK